MSDRGRPHNLGQVLFESLGAGLGAYGRGLEQERIRKSETQQQSFLNNLRVEEGQRSEERLGLQKQRLENDLIGEMSFNPNFISDLDQSLIDQRNASTSLSAAREGALGTSGGTGGGDLPAGVRSGMVRNFLDKAFETVDSEGDVTGIRKVSKFSLAQSPEEMAAIADSARSLGMFGDFRDVGQSLLSGLGKEPVFPPIERPSTLGMPDSARAQITASLQQKYGESWNIISEEDKEALIQNAFLSSNQ